MANHRVQILRQLFILALLCVAWWVIPGVIKAFTRSAIYEFEAPVWSTTTTLNNLEDYWILRQHSKQDLIEAGRDLARLNAAYELSLSEKGHLRAENQRLEALLNLPSLPKYRYEVARVIHRDLSTWWQQIVIDKGKNYNITSGMAVVFSGGVVGRVKEVHARSSIIELVSSRNFRMAANILGDQRPITYQGYINQPFTTPQGEVRNIPTDITVSLNEPKRIVSNRLGGVFPAGIPIGTIRRLIPSEDGLFQSGLVQLDPRLLSLSEVALLIPITPDKEVASHAV